MNDARGILDAQSEAMIARLRRYQSDQIGTILDRGHASANAVVQGAFAGARASVGKAVQRERRRREAEALTVRARAETRTRLESQLQVGRLLAKGWEKLPAVLDKRWRDTRCRRQWWQGAIAVACQRLLGERLLIEYAPGPAPTELEDMAECGGGRHVDLRCVAELQAGLRISSDGAYVDATTQSLMANGDQVRSLLLAVYQDVDGDAGANDA